MGLLISSYASTAEAHQLLNFIIGFGIAGTGFGPILAVVGRSTSPEKRSLALGITTAAGSAGQVIGPPITSLLLNYYQWSLVFVFFTIVILTASLLLPLLKTKKNISKNQLNENLSDVLIKAFKDPSFAMIFLGFFFMWFSISFYNCSFSSFYS